MPFGTDARSRTTARAGRPERSRLVASPPRSVARAALCAALVACAMLVPYATRPLCAADDPPAEAAPIGQFVTVAGAVNDAVHARVRNAATKLRRRAQEENRPGVLVLEITPGSSPFHHVQGLARFLTSSEASGLRLVAWIPKTVTGHNAVLALACHEVVLHPDAEFGDFGRGQALDKEEQAAVLAVVAKQPNPLVSPALARGFLDPAAAVLKATVAEAAAGGQAKEVWILSPAEVETLRQAGTDIQRVETIKEAGLAGRLSGTVARRWNVLARHTAEERPQVADLYRLPREAMHETEAGDELPKAALIRIDDMIEPVLASFLDRQIDRAVASGADLLIFEIDSLGGYLILSEQLAQKIMELESRKVRTVAWVPREAISGAALIALGADRIVLKPDARIGDAGPIEIRPGEAFERAPEKILSPLRLTLRTLADRKHRPAALCEAMADLDLEVFQVTNRNTGQVWYMSREEWEPQQQEWELGPLVPESKKGLLLTVSGTRAHALKLADEPANDLDELKIRLGIPADVELKAAGRTWVDTLVFLLNTDTAAFVLFVLGGVCLFLEAHFTTGILGIVSAVCFGLFFWARFLGGTAGWLEVVLFLLGIAFLALEIFVIPGFGVFGVSGGMLVLASVVLASQTWGNIEPDADWNRLARTMGTLAASAVSVIVLAVAMNRFLPSIPLFDRMILAPPGGPGDDSAPKLRPDLTGEHAADGLPQVGALGTAHTMLRPAGRALFGGRYVDVVSSGEFVNPGAQIEVVEVEGHRIVVREA